MSTLVEPGRTLAELGCGNGRDALYFASLGLDVVAMDLSEAAIGMLRQQPVPHARFVCGDFVSHTLHQPESYDYAYSRFTIHAINQKQERMLLGSMARASSRAESSSSRCAASMTRSTARGRRWSATPFSTTTTTAVFLCWTS